MNGATISRLADWMTRVGAALCGAVLLGGPAWAQPASQSSVPVAFTRAASKVAPGQVVGRMKWGVLCITVDDVVYSPSRERTILERFPDIFYKEVIAAGYTPLHDPNNLFDDKNEKSIGDLQIAASVEAVKADLCDVYGQPPDLTPGKGKVSITIEWQIYSASERRVVARVQAVGESELKATTGGATDLLLTRALTMSSQKFLASPEFRQAYSQASKAPVQTVAVKGSNLSPLTYQNRNNGPATVADGVGGVVAIFNGDGMGSGFLIGAEGFVLTNRHVVGADKYVKVRWADGVETIGEVLRSDLKRDVALVKTDARGRAPLRLQTSTPQPGEDVYAIGMPLDERYQSTVTKGIVSANRTVDGLSFIQSDVAINHGNSGGPLLDKSGAVLGITVSSVQPVENVQVGINLFIPLRDALDFLALKPQG